MTMGRHAGSSEGHLATVRLWCGFRLGVTKTLPPKGALADRRCGGR
jgi:hypothetical protein